MKVVYFDEGTANDYLTIKNEGLLQQKKGTNNQNKKEVTAAAKLGLGPKLSKVVDLFFSVEGSVGGSFSKSSEKIVQTSITNAILSDFLASISIEGTTSDSKIESLLNFTVSPEKNSIAYFQMISPYMIMTEGSLEAGEGISLSVNKIHEALKLSKGYYEMVALSGGAEEKIFRFNNQAFVNNYSISDLSQMNLVYYGFKVGKMEKEDLDFEKYIKKLTADKILTHIPSQVEEQVNPFSLDVYDIVLAGVI
ncbi:hypothetical protein HB943_06990 [Listeria weihenstephanensis]|uniref:Uncharacterized protein n=1 Tax=Listeria weihenstephanensis TaxID=1006155 RepID=A0A841Z518_9LIST|nr:DUF6414 family protein [Listeria weihenstephanensis]MBC1500344.1 hypothetical protein [Listeria weihenstephanensis]